MDNGKLTALTLLDLFVGFDTIDIILQRLHRHFVISAQPYVVLFVFAKPIPTN